MPQRKTRVTSRPVGGRKRPTRRRGGFTGAAASASLKKAYSKAASAGAAGAQSMSRYRKKVKKARKR